MTLKEDYFEKYIEYFYDAPSLALVRSVELKNFSKEFIKHPVLDLCCGDGFFAECLGLDSIYGCDVDKSVIQKAKDRGIYTSVEVCDARDLSSYQNDYFQTVMANCALEHVDGIDEALKSIVRVLKPNGHLIMSVPSYDLNNWYIFKGIFEKIGLSKIGEAILEKYNRMLAHINIYPFDIWKQKLEKNQFKIKKYFYLFSEKEYKIATFLDSFGLPFLRILYTLFRKITSTTFRKFVWRNTLKPIYLNSEPIDIGGELVIVAVKK